MHLDPESCYRALAARDPRFDGLFFIGVETTGIYCRPVCPARTPRRDRCSFFASAALAEKTGFRACFRCRPELSPGTFSSGGASAIDRALALIDEGAPQARSQDALARELGISSRHLRRLCEAQLGVSPVELAQSRRLALAKQLLHDTRLPITQVALASGFGSLRRLHALFAARFGRPPSALRKDMADRPGCPLRLRLDYRPPYAWPAALRRLASASLADLERVSQGTYARAVRLGGHVGVVRVSAGPAHLVAEIDVSLAPVVMQVVARLRRLFDLDARPDLIDTHLALDPTLRPLVLATPGLRVVGPWDPLESALRVVLGRAASRELVARHGDATAIDGTSWRLFPATATLVALSRDRWRSLGLSPQRAGAARALVHAAADSSLLLARGGASAAIAALASIPGLGDRVQTIALRALAAPDAFPAEPPRLRAALTRAEAWRPWRAYAAEHLLLSRGTRHECDRLDLSR